MSNIPNSNRQFNTLQHAAYQLASCTDQLFEQIEQQQTLNKIIDRIRSSLDLDIILMTTAKEIRQLLNADRVGVFCFTPGSGWDEGEFVAEDVAPEFPSAMAAKVYDHCFGSQFATYYTQGRVQSVADIYDAKLSDCHIQILEQFQVRANLIVPVLKGKELWGLLCIHQCSNPRRWQLSEIEFIQKISAHFAIALQQSDYLKQLQDKVILQAQAQAQEKALIRQKALLKITNKIRQSLEWEIICKTATEEVRQLLELDRVAIYRFNSDWSGDFIFESIANGWKELVGVLPTIEDTHLMETQGGRYAKNETFAIPDIYEAGHSDCHVTLLEQFQARAYAIAPIFQGNKLWGLLAGFQNSAPRQWQVDEIELLAQVGEQLGIAIQQAKEQESKINRQKTLVKITNRIRQSFEWEIICKTATEEVRQLLELDRVAIYRFNSDWSGDFIFESVANGWKKLVGVLPTIEDTHLMETQGGRYTNNETFAIPDIYAAGHSDCHVTLLEQFQARAYAIAPIFQDKKLWGLLAGFQNSAPRHWQVDEIELLAQVGEQLGIALKQSKFVQDIQTKSVELEQMLQELETSQIHLIHNEKMASLGQLVAGIAHEINNPVNYIYGNLYHMDQYLTDLLTVINYSRNLEFPPNTNILAKDMEEIDIDFICEDLPKMITSMQSGANRIQNIILSLRNFSRLDESDFKEVDIHEGIDNTLLILNHRITAYGDNYEIQVIKDYREIPQIECYPAQLNQVFINILANAIDAIEEAIDNEKLKAANQKTYQEPKIWITTRLIEEHKIEICIRDNGIGIDEKHKSQIFEQFFTTKKIGNRTGLGLTISHQIITEKHGGKINLNQNIHGDTECVITLPIKIQNK